MAIIATVIGWVILKLNESLKEKLSPNANYIIWLVFLITLIFPIAIPSKVSIYNYIDISGVKYVRNEKINQMIELWKKADNDSEIDYISTNHNKIWKNQIKRIIAYIWFIVFIIKFIRTMRSYTDLGRNIRSVNQIEERVILILENCKKKLKIKRNIKLIKQEEITMPSTIGVFNVRILVTDFLLNLDDSSLENIFMHELSHYKRKDNVVNFIMLILRAVYWFNPIVKIIFKKIRTEMEYATDEMVVSTMNTTEQFNYCRIMVMVAGMISSSKDEEPILLGLSSSAEAIEKRITMISRKKEFEKNFKVITITTSLIVLLMCFIFYPTSYGMLETTKLYLQLENGEKVEIIKAEENQKDINEIRLTPNSKVDLIVKGGKPNDYIFLNKIDLNTMKSIEETASMLSNEISYFQYGEYKYEFILTYANKQSMKYAIKIIVE